MNDHKTSLELRLLSLLHQARDENDESARAELNTLLRENAEARILMPLLLVDEQALVSHLREECITELIAPVALVRSGEKAASGPARWLAWRPLAAMAAGVVCGLFSASLVYGFVGQRKFSVVSLLKEGFEDVAMVRDRGVPARVDVWSGDLLAPQAATGEVAPAEGSGMVQLPTVEKRKFSYAFRFVDLMKLPLAGTGRTRRIEVTAQFHSGEPGMHDRFQIRLAAFAEDTVQAREIWVRDRVDEQALLHVVKTAKTQPADRGWTLVRSVIDVPAEAKVLLISLASAVGENDPAKTAHYLDDVQVRLITHDAVLP